VKSKRSSGSSRRSLRVATSLTRLRRSFVPVQFSPSSDFCWQPAPEPTQRPLAYYLNRPASAPIPSYSRPAPYHAETARPAYTEPLSRATHIPPQPALNSYRRTMDPELLRAEEILRSLPKSHDACTCKICQHETPTWREAGNESLPPQAMLSRALRELEEDFASHKACVWPRLVAGGLTSWHRIFVELSDAYKKLDPASSMHKRHALAKHLRESIDALESKVRSPVPHRCRLMLGCRRTRSSACTTCCTTGSIPRTPLEGGKRWRSLVLGCLSCTL
jgi:hypothetical protein